MPWQGDGRLNQARNCAVESTWSSCLPFGKTVTSWRYSAIHGAVSVDEAVLDHRGLREFARDCPSSEESANLRFRCVGAISRREPARSATTRARNTGSFRLFPANH